MTLLLNRRAKFDYEIAKELIAGIVLSGPEVKSLRNKSGSLVGSFVKIMSDEAFLLNAQITPYKFANNKDYDPKRTRKLLLSKKELRWSPSPFSYKRGKLNSKLALAAVRKFMKNVSY